MKSMLRIAAAFAFASIVSSVAAAGTMLAVPARHDLVDLAFDLQDLLNKDLTIACFKGEEAIETIEVFDRARGEWLLVSPERWASPYFPGCDKAVIVGMSKAASDLMGRSVWAKRSVQPTDRAYLDIVLAVNACETLTSEQWKSLASKHGFQIKEIKAPSRFELYEQQRKAQTSSAVAAPERPEGNIAPAQEDKELPAPFTGKSAFDEMPSATEEASRIAQAEETIKATAEKAADTTVDEEAAKKAAELKAAEEVAKKAAEEEAAKKAAELKAAEEAAKKAAAEEAAKKAAELKAAEEAAKKAAEEEAAKKAAELKAAEEAAKKAAEEAAKKAAEEAAAKAEAAAKKVAEPVAGAVKESNVPLATPPVVEPAPVEPPAIKIPSVKLDKVPEAKPVADVTPPEIKVPEVKVPEVTAPEVTVPEVKAPEVKAPAIKVPETAAEAK